MKISFPAGTFLFALSVVFAGMAQARFMMPSLVPTERILKNAKAYLAENPESPDAHYTIARIHYLTFTNRMWFVQGWESGGSATPSRVAPDYLISFQGSILERARRVEAEKRAAETIDRQKNRDKFYAAVNQELEKLKSSDWKPASLSNTEILAQATQAATAFDKAISLDPDNALYLLGKASLEDQVSDFLAQNSDLPKAEAPLDSLSPESILRSYLAAYEASREKDLDKEFLPVSGLKSMVTYEAGHAILEMAEGNASAAGKVEDLDLKQIKKDLEKLKKLKRGAITPIIISDDPDLLLSDLIRESPVHFDVDGDGRKETLDSWPNTRAALLVWDPTDAGQIRSGRQWFGTFGFNMLWRDGYQAMDALDDSRDGWLSGEEIRGIALWRDANGNSISDPGEVRSLESCGIKALSVKPESRDSLQNRKGVHRADGSFTASHDWIFELIEQP